MQHHRFARRAALLALSLLSACAAADPSGATTETRRNPAAHAIAPGASSAFLAGRFAAQEGDIDRAADELLRAQSLDPDSREVRREAFLAAMMAGRPEAVRLARDQKDDPAALLLLGNADAKSGDWESAERRFAALPRQGLTQVLLPLMVAWAQAGQGRTDAALATLKPYVEGQRFRAVYAFHAAMVADLGSRPGEAARLYKLAQAEFGSLNLDLARNVASWQARSGRVDEAKQTLDAFVQTARDFAIALPRMDADVSNRQVRRASDGLAAVYVGLAVSLRQQDSAEFAAIMLRLALDLRGDMTAARLLASDLAEQAKHPDQALDILKPVADSDPLAPVVELRRANLLDRTGNTEAALRLAASVAATNPQRPEPWTLQGEILRSKRRYPEAVAAFDKAIALLPLPHKRIDWPLYYERGMALERSHDWPKAEADFLYALKLSPDEPFVLNYLGYSWTEQHQDLAKARAMIMKAAEMRPTDGAILDSLGWVNLQQGDVAASVKWLEKAAELDSEDATINGHLGDAYWAAGRKLEATYQWQRALTLKPDPDELQRIQTKLHDAQRALGLPVSASVEPAAQ
jgi:tetratricopeptide (TPR) repeat protein